MTTLDIHPLTVRQRAQWARWREAAVMVVGLGLVFQALHVGEHVVQVAAWLRQPLDAAFLTPWAVVGRDALAAAVGRGAPLGAELLHLVGNLIFVLALAGLRMVDRMDRLTGRRPASVRRTRLLRWATVAQVVHVTEHVALTASLATTGTAVGVSTLLGALPAGTPAATALRVVLHFVLNAIPTLLVLAALHVGRATPATAPATG